MHALYYIIYNVCCCVVEDACGRVSWCQLSRRYYYLHPPPAKLASVWLMIADAQCCCLSLAMFL